MTRFLGIVTFFLVLVASAGLYQLKYQVDALQQQRADLQYQMREDRAAIEVLEAEWAYLTRPERLQQLSERFLHLAPIRADQIAGLDELPLRKLQSESAYPDLTAPDLPQRPDGIGDLIASEARP